MWGGRTLTAAAGGAAFSTGWAEATGAIDGRSTARPAGRDGRWAGTDARGRLGAGASGEDAVVTVRFTSGPAFTGVAAAGAAWGAACRPSPGVSASVFR